MHPLTSPRDVRNNRRWAQRVDGTLIVGYPARRILRKSKFHALGQAIIADGCSPKARDIDVRIINQQGGSLGEKDIHFHLPCAQSGTIQ